MNKIFFTVGPSAIYPQVSEWSDEYFKSGYGSISHRSIEFQDIYKKLNAELRTLMKIPDSHCIFIASSGSEILERILQNCVSKSTFHFVNGAFSEKFYNYSLRLGYDAQKYEIDYGQGFEIIPEIGEDTDLICVTHNETSTGIKTMEDFIHKIKLQNPKSILAVDAVSSAPFITLDYSLVDICFFSSQKAFGIPAGLGIWVINKEVAERCKNHSAGAHNTLSDYLKNYQKFQTPSTPNTLGVYLMGEVAEDMNKKGIDLLTKEMLAKKKMFHSIFHENSSLKLINDGEYSSDTVIVAKYIKSKTEIDNLLKANNIICSSGYKEFKETQIRFANFPANSISDIECLKDVFK